MVGAYGQLSTKHLHAISGGLNCIPLKKSNFIPPCMRNSLVVTSYEPSFYYIVGVFSFLSSSFKGTTFSPSKLMIPPQKKNRVPTISIGGNNLEGHDQFHLNLFLQLNPRSMHSSLEVFLSRFQVLECCLLFLFLLALFFGRTFVFLALLLFFPRFNSLHPPEN